ncbi:MAG: glycoside hydrolase family 43 protein [Planctomycetota bacterium]
MRIQNALTVGIIVAVASILHASVQAQLPVEEEVYLFTSFRGNGKDGLHLAYSRDGLKWTALKNDKSFLKPLVGGKLMRDPCIIKGPDQRFHMVWTSSWRDQGIGIAHSEDLITWSQQRFIPVMKHQPTAINCWAPEITWDPEGQQYVIYWATTIPEEFVETAASADKGWNHRMYFTTTKDFKSYTETKLFYEPGFNVIDSTIIPFDDRFLMIAKNETKHPPAKNLHVASSEKVTGPWKQISDSFSPKGVWVEGPTALQVGDEWYVYFDAYAEHRYGAMRTKDFENWQDVSDELVVPKNMRHGTAFTVSPELLDRLLKE